ncbi:MAG: carboxypeptidase-like regulatory domain-containing protein [Bryobacteraceae bacterium]
MKRNLVAFLAMLVMLVMPISAQKKDREDATKRSVQGTVTDPSENAIDGAVVQLKDTKSLQIRSFITKTNGSYHFHGLSPDIDYELKADYQGSLSDQRR